MNADGYAAVIAGAEAVEDARDRLNAAAQESTLANLKLIPVSLAPLGKEIIAVDSPARWERVQA